MSEAPDRLRWALKRRRELAAILPGFWASCLSYAVPDCVFSAYNRIYRRAFLRSSTLGRMSYVAENSRIGFTDIGAFSSIGPNVSLGGLGWHPIDRLSTHPAFYSNRLQAGVSFADTDKSEEQQHELRRTIVGNDVWMGVGCIVLDGLTIGDGAVIAAGAVVTKNVPPYAIVGGVPARIIRYRFDEATIAALLDWCWWDLSSTQLKMVTEHFMAHKHWSPAAIEQIMAELAASQAELSVADMRVATA